MFWLSSLIKYLELNTINLSCLVYLLYFNFTFSLWIIFMDPWIQGPDVLDQFLIASFYACSFFWVYINEIRSFDIVINSLRTTTGVNLEVRYNNTEKSIQYFKIRAWTTVEFWWLVSPVGPRKLVIQNFWHNLEHFFFFYVASWLSKFVKFQWWGPSH